MDLQKNNNTSEDDDDLTRIFDIRKGSLELLVVRTTQRVVVPIMEDLVRKVVKEQIELVQENLMQRIELVQENLMQRIQCNLNRQGNTSEPRCLRLMFSQNVSSPVHTSTKIKGESGISINLVLVDSLTGEAVKSGPEAAAKVEILVLKGDCVRHKGCNGKFEDFNDRIVSEMEGKKSILQGTTTLELKEGICSIADLSFTQNSRWTRKSKLCLGARAVNSFPGTIVEPAETEPFDLKDQRTKAYAKEEIPSLLDKVSRLKHIGKSGSKHLNDEKIFTVKDLVAELNSNPERLRKILNVGSKTWEEITDHAKTCIIDEEVYLYIDPDLQQKSGVVFDVKGQVKGLLKESQYFTMNMLSDDEQKDAQKLVGCAFDRWEEVSRYNDEKSLMECISRDSPNFDTCGQCKSDFCNGICASINSGESSQSGSPGLGLWGPMYSPFRFEEILQSMNYNDQPERHSPELKPKLAWIVICVSRWIMIRKRVGSLERVRAKKKQKMS